MGLVRLRTAPASEDSKTKISHELNTEAPNLPAYLYLF